MKRYNFLLLLYTRIIYKCVRDEGGEPTQAKTFQLT